MTTKHTILITAACCIAAACKPDSGAKAPQATTEYTVAAADTMPPSALLPADSTYTIAMAGDIMMGTTYPDSVLPADEGRLLFADAAQVLRRADIAAGNLEGTLCDTTCHTKKTLHEYNYAFRTPVEYAARLGEAGFDFLCMANNHSLDFGWDGVRSTEHALDGQDIAYAGLRGRRKWAIIERRGVKFGLCAFGHNAFTISHKRPDEVTEILDTLRAMADIIIVSFHGGGEGTAYSHLPYGHEEYIGEDRGSLREFAHLCIDHGADIVFGHGPHVVRCVELYRDRLIAYSLGNFCTPFGISVAGVSGYAPVIEARIDRQGHFITGQIHPFIQRRGIGPRRDTTGVVINRIRELTAEDIPYGRLIIADDGTITDRNNGRKR